MSFRIIADSCCDKTVRMADWDNITFVPLTLELGDYRVLDDENLDRDDYLQRMSAYNGVARTACPSPEAWASAINCAEEDIYIITVTEKLSGTYNSAMQGVALYREEHPESQKNIHVFNSRGTAGVETLLAEEIYKLASQGMAFETLVEQVEDFIVHSDSMIFYLGSLDAMKNNGRLFALAASLLEKLRVKLILERTEEGNIAPAAQDITVNRALAKMASLVISRVEGRDLSDKRMIISYVSDKESAEMVRDKICASAQFGSTEIVRCSGLNITYTDVGGVLVCFTK